MPFYGELGNLLFTDNIFVPTCLGNIQKWMSYDG